MSNIIDLDALVRVDRLPQVQLFGRALTIMPLTGAAAHRIATVQADDANGAGMLAALLDVIGVLLPTLSVDERAALSVEQIGAIVQLSRGQIADVEAQIAELSAKN